MPKQTHVVSPDVAEHGESLRGGLADAGVDEVGRNDQPRAALRRNRIEYESLSVYFIQRAEKSKIEISIFTECDFIFKYFLYINSIGSFLLI